MAIVSFRMLSAGRRGAFGIKQMVRTEIAMRMS